MNQYCEKGIALKRYFWCKRFFYLFLSIKMGMLTIPKMIRLKILNFEVFLHEIKNLNFFGHQYNTLL